MDFQHQELATSILSQALEELSLLLLGYTDTNGVQVRGGDVRAYGGMGASLLPNRQVGVSELKEVIAHIDAVLAGNPGSSDIDVIEYGTAIRNAVLSEFRGLSQAWHDMSPSDESPGRTKWTVDVREYGGFAPSFLPKRHISLSELDEMIAFMDQVPLLDAASLGAATLMTEPPPCKGAADPANNDRIEATA